ncbi:MAG TPA: hypothetical protein VHL85_04560 [Burkholderiales bacterium]|jgi:putative phosphoribosyl transferase|nr:hypothetical protein [Burkholderiales bacterium]
MEARELSIHVSRADVRGTLRAPADPLGVVVLVHGSGVTRRDARIQELAALLEESGLETLLTDLLEDYEAHDPSNVFDVDLQARRLVDVLDWLRAQPGTRGLPLGLLGTGIGTGVVLAAAAKAPGAVSAVACCGGRPDTASQWLPSACTPTLFISAEGEAVPDFTAIAYEHCNAPKELQRAPREAVAARACEWLKAQLVRNRPTPVPV